MTSCKEISCESEKPKRTVFQVEIDLDSSTTEQSREKIVRDLRNTGYTFTRQLSNIIEKG